MKPKPDKSVDILHLHVNTHRSSTVALFTMYTLNVCTLESVTFNNCSLSPPCNISPENQTFPVNSSLQWRSAAVSHDQNQTAGLVRVAGVRWRCSFLRWNTSSCKSRLAIRRTELCDSCQIFNFSWTLQVTFLTVYQLSCTYHILFCSDSPRGRPLLTLRSVEFIMPVMAEDL